MRPAGLKPRPKCSPALHAPAPYERRASRTYTAPMATLHFVCGKAGAGKTTLARRLARELPGARICEDEWLSRMGPPVTRFADYVAHTGRLRSQLGPHIVELL